MKKLVLQKVVTLVAALALGSACIANDALARGGGGGGMGGGGGGFGGGGFGGHGGGGFGGNGGGGDHMGGGFAGGHMGGFPGGRMGGDFHAGLRDDHELGRISTPFLYGNYGDNAQGFACWKSQRIPTNAAWRLRQAGNGECY